MDGIICFSTKTSQSKHELAHEIAYFLNQDIYTLVISIDSGNFSFCGKSHAPLQTHVIQLLAMMVWWGIKVTKLLTNMEFGILRNPKIDQKGLK